MNTNKAMEIRTVLKKFWRNWKEISRITEKNNKLNKDCYSWQYYFGGESCGDPSLFPEITNHQLILWMNGDEKSKEYPLESEIAEFKTILAFSK